MCVCTLALDTRHANFISTAQYYIVVCGLSGCTVIFTHHLKSGTIFGGEKKIGHKICLLIFSTTFVSKTSHFK